MIFPENMDTSTTIGSGGNALNVQCNGNTYGFNPNIADCEQAKSYIVPDSEQILWGERHTGLPAEIFPLPYAIFGDRAECFFQAINIGDSPMARASMSQFRSAANALLINCALGSQSQGGIATNIGGDNNLAIVMGTFQPQVQCRGNFIEGSSCESILADMPASTDNITFGPSTGPDVQEPLPLEIVSDDYKCMLKVFSTGRPDTGSWYRIWQATEATYAVCTKAARFGSFRGLGDNGGIFATLTAGP